MVKKLLLSTVFAAAMQAAPAMADPIVVGQWYTFGFNGAGSALMSGAGVTLGVDPTSIAAPGTPWTFTLAGAGTLTVVDGFNSGDQFQLTDFGSVIGTTSVPVLGADCSNDITACLANSSESKGVFNLAAGNHSLGGTALLSPFGAGGAFFRVAATAAVPEPATWALMLAGFGAVGFAMRRRQKVAVKVTCAA